VPLLSEAHRLLVHCLPAGVMQVPALQVDAAVADPLVQLGSLQIIEVPGIKQAAALLPSHCPLHLPEPAQATRVPRGSP
jgi:hypothetical protein